jgi:hypothetical protein
MPNKFPVPTRLTRSGSSPASLPATPSVQPFQTCYERFQECLEFADSTATSSLIEAASSFVLDFDIVAKRALQADSPNYRLFRMHYLEQQSRQVCCDKLKLTHWSFAAELRAIEQRLSAALTAAGLFPLAPYFSPSQRPERLAA